MLEFLIRNRVCAIEVVHILVETLEEFDFRNQQMRIKLSLISRGQRTETIAHGLKIVNIFDFVQAI